MSRRRKSRPRPSGGGESKAKTPTGPAAGARPGALGDPLRELDPAAPGNGTAREARASIIGVVLLLCLLLVPFSGKAIHADDPLFIWTAKNIQRTPANPYGFAVNWYGTRMPMAEVTKNPPLASYYLAAVASLFGWGEWALHLAFLVPALLTGIGSYLLARRFCDHPLLATLAGVLTPVFLVSSLAIMCDVLMLAFWVFAIHFWLVGIETRSHAALALSGLLVTLATLSKYFGLTLIPLLLLYAVAKERRVGWWALYLLIPVGVLAEYQWITQRLYGRELLLDATVYATAFSAWSIAKAHVGLAFAGGCVASIFFFAPFLWSWRVVAIGVAVSGGIALVIGSSVTTLGDFSLPRDGFARALLAVQLGLCGMGGLGLLALATLDLRRRLTPDSMLLFAWTVGTFAFAAFVNWSTNGRSILPMTVPAGILIARRLEARAASVRGGSIPRTLIPLAMTALVSLPVMWADYRLAETARLGAARIHDRYGRGPRPIFFQGHWGFQYYMERLGARAVNVTNQRFVHGDIVAVPSTNTNIHSMPSAWSSVREVLEVPSSRWLATISLDAGAGYYSDAFGPLPFAVGSIPSERFFIYEVRPEIAQ